MITQNLNEAELNTMTVLEKTDNRGSAEHLRLIEESLAKQRKTSIPKEQTAAYERQRILALLAGMRRQFLRESENIKSPEGNEDVLLILNAKVIAVEQAMEAIEKE